MTEFSQWIKSQGAKVRSPRDSEMVKKYQAWNEGAALSVVSDHSDREFFNGFKAFKPFVLFKLHSLKNIKHALLHLKGIYQVSFNKMVKKRQGYNLANSAHPNLHCCSCGNGSIAASRGDVESHSGGCGGSAA